MRRLEKKFSGSKVMGAIILVVAGYTLYKTIDAVFPGAFDELHPRESVQPYSSERTEKNY